MQQTLNKNTVLVIPDYEIVSKIGEGGIAEIFKARQVSLNRDVAIKILFSELTSDPDIVKRFDHESLVIARLSHPNIVHVIDKGKTDDRYYFVMEYVQGKSFKEIIYSNDYTVRQKLEMLVKALKGLDYAHKNGVIHRDIKPANILIDIEDNVQVADFGIAQILEKPDQEMTSSDVIMGTLAYMSPEQKTSSANVDITTDIYPMGIMIYEILAGNKPAGRFKMPSELDPKINKRFDEIIAKCLAPDPDDRFQSAVELKDEILNLISGNTPANLSRNDAGSHSETFIGKCQYLDTLKETKYGSTMLVENKETNELYVIKKKERSSDGLKEARMLSSKKHDSIINIIGAGGDARKVVIMMEYAPGGSLADRMVKQYPFEEAIRIVLAAADGLDFAHSNGIVHGNLRPSNILFTGDNEVKLADFGMPPHYNLMEKNWYAPPEKKISRQGDMYALGVILYKLLLGKNPAFDRSGKVYLSGLGNDVPEAVKKMLTRMLSIRAAQRYENAEEFLRDWDAYQSTLYRPRHQRVETNNNDDDRRRKQRIKVAIIMGVSIFVTAIVLTIVFLR